MKSLTSVYIIAYLCLPPCGGSGLKCSLHPDNRHQLNRLPPCGGSGLKFAERCNDYGAWLSPSMRREWIEITEKNLDAGQFLSPSMRREWIEMEKWNRSNLTIFRLPPCGGSGLKCRTGKLCHVVCSLPPCGGSGLKLARYMAFPETSSLPPCGGSGLK